MFRKIITNLPFQPASLGMLSAYIRQLKKDTLIRQITLVVFVLIFIVQLFIIISPPSASLATNPSDIIYGANSQQEVLQSYANNRDMLGRTDIQAIYGHYGISQDQIINAKQVTLNQEADRTYIVSSRNPSNLSDTYIGIPGDKANGIYEFPLSYWGKNSYQALSGVNSFGYRYWILLNGSGSVVYSKSLKSPSFEINKQITSNPNPRPGQNSTYLIAARNKGSVVAENTVINTQIPADFEFQSYTSNRNLLFTKDGQKLSWKLKNNDSSLPPSTSWLTIAVDIKAKEPRSAEQISCDNTSISSSNGPLVYANDSSQTQCITIKKITCPATGAPIASNDTSKCPVNCPDGATSDYSKTCAKPQLTCESLQLISSKGWDSKTYRTSILAQNGATPSTLTYYINNNPVHSEQLKSDAKTNEFTYGFPSPGEYNVKAELSSPEGSVQQSQNCQITQDVSPPNDATPMIDSSISVKNVTKNGNATAKPGDILDYTVTIKNISDKNIDSFALTGEYALNISDILEYTNLSNKNDAIYNEPNGTLSWGDQSIKAGDSISKTFTVIVKAPAVTSLTSESNPLSYNLSLDTVYGNTVQVKLDRPLAKTIEQAIAKMPHKPNLAVIAVSVLALIAAIYLYLRSRLLLRESEIIHNEYSSGGL